MSAPDPGAPDLPANALDDARHLLHGVLEGTFELVGWPAERVHAYPPPTIATPCAFVDAPTLSAQGAGLVSTWPLVVAVDSIERAQVARLDALLAIVWERLSAVKIPLDAERLAAGSTVQLMSGGPEQLDLGGPSTRSILLTVQVPIGPRTLCPTALTTPNGD